MLRSAHCLGATGVLASAKNCAPLSAAVSKASAGALEVMTLHNSKNLPRTLADAAERGWAVVGAAGEAAATPVAQFRVNRPTVLVMGEAPRVKGRAPTWTLGVVWRRWSLLLGGACCTRTALALGAGRTPPLSLAVVVTSQPATLHVRRPALREHTWRAAARSGRIPAARMHPHALRGCRQTTPRATDAPRRLLQATRASASAPTSGAPAPRWCA
jgi:hypothetical protein